MTKPMDDDVASPLAMRRRRIRNLLTLDGISREIATLYRMSDRGEITVGDASRKANILAIQVRVLEARHVERIEAKLDQLEAELLRDDDTRPLLSAVTVRN
jgi:hypothetical protein